MDETTIVGELRADAPLPDRARLAPGRQRLLDSARSGGDRVRGLRSDWRTAAAGAVVAITVAAVTTTLLVGGDGHDRAPVSLVGGAGKVGSARDVLLDAAAMVEDDPVPRPGAEQWIYTRESTYNASMSGSSGIMIPLDPGQEPPPGATPTHMPGVGRSVFLTGPGPHEVEEWTPFADPAAEKGKKDDDYSAREIFAFLADLPDDPEKVLDKVLAFYPTGPASAETPEEHAFRALGLLTTEQPIVHPEGLAKVYRAMAGVPGLKAGRVTDTAGRETVAIGRKESGGAGKDADIRMYLLDPATGLPVGELWTAGKDSPTPGEGGSEGGSEGDSEGKGAGGRPLPGKGPGWKKGDVYMANLVLESALVAEEHERP